MLGLLERLERTERTEQMGRKRLTRATAVPHHLERAEGRGLNARQLPNRPFQVFRQHARDERNGA
jgi:hypothetical protein